MINLNKILTDKKTTLTAWVEFADGFKIELEYAEPAEVRRFLKKSKRRDWVRHQQVDTYDDALFAAQVAKKVKNWEGLTLGLLSTLVAIDVDPGQEEMAVEFNQENLAAMLDKVPGFLGFVSASVQELALFRAEVRAARVKNLEPSRASKSG